LDKKLSQEINDVIQNFFSNKLLDVAREELKQLEFLLKTNMIGLNLEKAIT